MVKILYKEDFFVLVYRYTFRKIIHNVNNYETTYLWKEGEIMDNRKESVTYDTYEDLESMVYLIRLDLLVDEKTSEYISYANKQKNLKQKAEWIKNWKKTTKQERLGKIIEMYTCNNISYNDLEIPKKLFESYSDYFNVIDREKDIKSRYQEMFNTIIQIPAEISEHLAAYKEMNRNANFLDTGYNSQIRKYGISCSDNDCLPIAA
jgi:hypothetical protein